MALLALNWILSGIALAPPPSVEVPYTLFREQVQAGNVVEVTTVGDRIQGQFEQAVTWPTQESAEAAGGRTGVPPAEPLTATLFSTQRPAFADDGLMDLLLREKVVVNAEPPDKVPLWQQLVFGFGPTLLFVGLLIWVARRSAGAGLGSMGLGRSKAHRYTPETG
ncbi:MAG: cell division protein FtsH, partial [Actinomycetota bacterium]|nr:cell division protein FtsH [Actinomycetota bacterium]